MAKCGRPRKLGSPADLEKGINDYVRMCEREDKFPDEAGMLLYLGISKAGMKKYCGYDDQSELVEKKKFNPDDTYGYKQVFEHAALIRESWLARKMAADGKGANGYMNLLKQPSNGGYKDRYQDEGDRAITINLVGVGGETNFK